MRSYDALAEDLSKGYERYFAQVAQAEADRFLSRLRPGCRVLDLGCGAGVASEYLVARGCLVVSADLSLGMLDLCRQRGLSGLVQLDMANLPFADSSFDAVWAHTSLIHIAKREVTMVLDQVARVLKANGALFLALRLGNGEGYEGDETNPRWFANYSQNEFEHYLPQTLCPVRQSITAYGSDRRFLNYHLDRA